MIHAVKSIPWHAWAAAIMGLLLGFALRSEPLLGDEGVGTDSGPGRAVRAQSTRRAIIPKNGPTTLYLNGLASAPVSHCEELFREIVLQKDTHRTIELEGVFRRWMELEDPKALFVRLTAEPGLSPRSLWAGPFFEAWASVNYAEAVAGTARHGEFAGIRTLVAIRRQDPSFLDGSSQIWNFDDSRVVNALALLGRDNPALAKYVATYHGGKPDNNAGLIAAVARGWSAMDPEAALEWVTSLELSDNNRKKSLDEVFLTWMKNDLVAATEASKSGGLAEETSRRFPRSLTLSALRTPGSTDSQIYMANHLDPFLDLEGLYQRLSAATIDLGWGSTMRPIDHDGWFCTDPARAAEEAARLPAGEARDFLMRYIYNQWADRSPDEATAYAPLHEIGDPFKSDGPSAEMVQTALLSPQETFASLLDRGQSGTIPYRYLEPLAKKWAAMEPQAAAEWLISQPGSGTYDYQTNPAAKLLFNNTFGYYWARLDAVGASRWVEDLPESPRKTEAWLAMNDDVRQYSPDLAFSITADLLHNEKRTGFLESNLKEVAEKIGSSAARELLHTAGLTQEERAVLNQALDAMEAKSDTP